MDREEPRPESLIFVDPEMRVLRRTKISGTDDILLLFPEESKPKNVTYVHNDRYKEYETAPLIADKWSDMSLCGACGVCGMDDAPIVLAYTDKPPKCKWCAEYANIKYHLRHNGQIRLRKYESKWDERKIIDTGACILFSLLALMILLNQIFRY